MESIKYICTTLGVVVITCILFFVLSSCVERPNNYRPGEKWQETKTAQIECEEMCKSIDAWCHRYRHYNTEKCICKNISWEYFHVTNDDGVVVVSRPTKQDFGK